MTATFRTVASGLVTRIDGQLTYLNTCRFYAGEIEEVDGAVQAFDQAPAVYVIFDGMEPLTEDEGFGEYVYRARYGAVVVAKTMGGAETKAESDTYSAHAIIEDLFEAVPGNNLGLTGFSGLTPGVVRRVKITPRAAIYVVEFTGLVQLAK